MNHPSASPRAVTVLTSAGRGRLEDRLAAAMNELEGLEVGTDTTVDAFGSREASTRLKALIASLRGILDSAVNPNDVTDDPTIVELGDEVEVAFDDGETELFVLVHPIEIASESGYVSVEAPLGRALLGRRVGERVAILAPGGDYEVEVVARRRSS